MVKERLKMEIICVMVTSLNGKITRGDEVDISSWASKEDSEYFSSLIRESNLVVMGSKTYQAAEKKLRSAPNKLRVVITRDPDKYKEKEIPGQLEFTSDGAEGLVKRLEDRGYTRMLLVGGREINKLFFKAGLVTKLYLTLEPELFGTGKDMVAPGEIELSFKLESLEKLNDNGTLLLKYRLK